MHPRVSCLPRALSLGWAPRCPCALPAHGRCPRPLPISTVALKFLPYGGLYISGGIAAKNPQWVQGKPFTYALHDKGRMSPLLQQVPIYLVLVEDTGARRGRRGVARAARASGPAPCMRH